jgi:hypothetical protein
LTFLAHCGAWTLDPPPAMLPCSKEASITSEIIASARAYQTSCSADSVTKSLAGNNLQ